MKLYHKVVLILFYIILFFTSVYSYALIDPNLTLVNSKWFEPARNAMVNFGYYQRQTSSVVYILLVLLLFFFHLYFVKNYKKIKLVLLLIPLGFLALFSYPFLSHDFFNYLFDAKILTFYHLNPYLFKALDFPHDPWIRFMHSTHRAYPYGPTFLPITLIPSFFSFGKFLVDFLLFKMMFFGFFALAMNYLAKINKRWSIFILTSPLVIIEGLVNSHNDILALSLALLGIYLLYKNRNIWARILLLFSAGVKYITAPFIILGKNKKMTQVVLIALIVVLIYLSFRQEIQPWYFLAIFGLLPYYEELIKKLNIFFAGLLFSYYPYIRFGEWDRIWKINLKHEIITIFFVINVLFLLYQQIYRYARRDKRLSK